MRPPGLQIERLSIEVAGLSAEDGQRLARLVARGLAAVPAVSAARSVPALKVELRATGDRNLPNLASRIVEATLDALRRTT
jgi:hypothetical protein